MDAQSLETCFERVTIQDENDGQTIIKTHTYHKPKVATTTTKNMENYQTLTPSLGIAIDRYVDVGTWATSTT